MISLMNCLCKTEKKKCPVFLFWLTTGKKKKKKRGLFLIHGKLKERIFTSVQISL